MCNVDYNKIFPIREMPGGRRTPALARKVADLECHIIQVIVTLKFLIVYIKGPQMVCSLVRGMPATGLPSDSHF